MKKRIILLLVLSLLLCGCAQQPQATAAPTVPEVTEPTQIQETADPEKFRVNLELWVTEQSIWADEGLLKEMLASFAAYYPNITVNITHVSAGDLQDRMPDLLLSDADTLAALASRGKTAELAGLWAEIDDAYENVQKACGDGESFFALPVCVVADCMAVRIGDFEAAEAEKLINTVSHTWNGANFLKAAENLLEAGKTNPLSIYCKDTSGDVHTRLLVENFGGGRYVKTLSGTYQIESDAMTQALRSISEAPGVILRRDLDAAGALEEFLAGDSAMVLCWNSQLQLLHGEDGEIVYMLPPSGGRARVYAKVFGLAVCENGDERQKAASMTLAAFLRDSGYAVRAAGQLPARKSGLDAYKGTGLEARINDLSKLLSYMESGEIPGKNWEDARKEWVLLLQNLADGKELAESIEACRAALEK